MSRTHADRARAAITWPSSGACTAAPSTALWRLSPSCATSSRRQDGNASPNSTESCPSNEPSRFSRFLHPAHGDRGDVALAQTLSRGLLVAFQRPRRDRKLLAERARFLDHRSQILAHRIDVDGDG